MNIPDWFAIIMALSISFASFGLFLLISSEIYYNWKRNNR